MKMSDATVQSAFSEKIGAAMPSDFSTRARVHYAKALEKHPMFFADMFVYDDTSLGEQLEAIRDGLEMDDGCEAVEANDLLTCEMYEAFVENKKGDAPRAIDELYDAIAVIMRMIAVLEKKQKLGREDAK